MDKIDDSKDIFDETDRHLTSDMKPSEYIDKISANREFESYPFNMVLRLKEAKQQPKYHPEGSVWNHTLLVVDQAARLREFAKEKRAFMWAALLHDIGKPDTTKIKKGRITSYGHDEAGSVLARRFLSEFTYDNGFIEKVAALVRWHMQILFVVKGMPWANPDAMKRETEINDITLLCLCDRLGRKGADECAALSDIRKFLENLNMN